MPRHIRTGVQCGRAAVRTIGDARRLLVLVLTLQVTIAVLTVTPGIFSVVLRLY